MFLVWIKFIINALIIVVAGARLTNSTELISRRLGLGVIWGGFFLLPLVTSLPELVTSLRAAVIDTPDLAVGNLLGSNLFNLSIIAIIDLFQRRGTILGKAKKNHVMTASCGLLMIGFTGLAIIFPFELQVSGVGFDTFILLFLYIIGSFLISSYERKDQQNLINNHQKAKAISGERTVIAVVGFILAGILIVFAGVNLADTAEMIARETGLGQTFVGTLFLAVSTSLPEVVTAVTAVRRGLFNMAIANVFGANYFNLVILFFADIAYAGGPLLSAVSKSHLVTSFLVVKITSMAVFGLVFRTSRRIAGLGYDSIAIVIGYLVSLLFLYFTNSSP